MRRPWLAPLIPLYAAGVALRDMRLKNGWEPTRRLRFPVISIGNLSMGGSGKTPLTIALARLLNGSGVHVDVLSRGYGRRRNEPARVRPDGTAEEFGDEPLLIAKQARVPVYVAKHRYEAGRLAEAEIEASGRQDTRRGLLAAAHILDDGFQHRQLARDIDILMLSQSDWHDHLLPGGNLRESLAAIRRASVVAIPADEAELYTELKASGWRGPVWRLHRRMNLPQIAGPVAAFCGIARPGQFFSGLRAAGLTLASETVFPDHHFYTHRDIERVLSEARTNKATALMTTEKDQVRLGSLAPAFSDSLPLKTAQLSIEIEDEAGARDWLTSSLTGALASAPL
jgi:tetraacyldisaccharide 4'-kinase